MEDIDRLFISSENIVVVLSLVIIAVVALVVYHHLYFYLVHNSTVTANKNQTLNVHNTRVSLSFEIVKRQ